MKRLHPGLLFPYILAFKLLLLTSTFILTQDSPNILLIIADDLGVDVSNGYQDNMLMPTTPHLDELRASGITFKNAWAAPTCSPTRASIMSGKYGIKTGVLAPPGNLDLEHTSIFTELGNRTENRYADALIGKWHISQPIDNTHPMQHGVDHYEGVITGAVQDYFNWTKVTNGVVSTETEYVTTNFTNGAIDWINAQEQDQAWFLWLAHVAPHSPYHVPPDSMYTIGGVGSNRRQYIAMIEAMDFEIGRLLDNIPEDELENTIIIYIGDNGTPGNIIQSFPSDHGKGTSYQGGIHVPLIVAGAGVERIGVEENALIHAADIYATILEIAGEELPGGIYNSMSFAHLLDGSDDTVRPYNYSESVLDIANTWTIRNDQYKLIRFEDGAEEFYDLLIDPLELNNLMLGGLNPDLIPIKNELTAEAEVIRADWSCNDLIQNGDEEGIDCGGTRCTPCITSTNEMWNSNRVQVYPNPAFDILNIASDDHVLEEIRIYDSLGKLLLFIPNPNTQKERVMIDQLPAGLLLVAVKTATGTGFLKVVNY